MKKHIISKTSGCEISPVPFSLIIIFLVFFSRNIMSQTIMPTKENTPLSDEHGVFMKEMTDSSLVFITTQGNEYLVHNPFKNISYIGGEKKLKEDMSSTVETYDSESNIFVLFYILFDNNLQIKDVRCIDVSPKVENWDSFINKYLLYLRSTQGKWIKNDNISCKYYLYGFAKVTH
ncbi:hypothetical protein [Segatella paludivivens]|uniref:hypothetical protein n=1 Tax=Segatella paludivivens TaxID=185294 RepID=UPI0003822F47|nr:hypothetical protein [Segatella paludivivens]